MMDGDNAGERGVMVAMGHGLCVSLCVCGETTKNKVFLKQINASWSITRPKVSNRQNLADNMAGYK